MVYRSTHTDHKRTYAITLTLWVSPDKSLCGMVCDVNGDFEKAAAFLYLEPSMTEGEWVWKSEYEEEERVLLFERKTGCASRPLDVLGVNAMPSMETGFFDTSYFIKMFKRYCGSTPLQYRRSKRV